MIKNRKIRVKVTGRKKLSDFFLNAVDQKLVDILILGWSLLKPYYVRYNFVMNKFYSQVNGLEDI